MCGKYPFACVMPEWFFVSTCCSANSSISTRKEKGKILILVLALVLMPAS